MGVLDDLFSDANVARVTNAAIDSGVAALQNSKSGPVPTVTVVSTPAASTGFKLDATTISLLLGALVIGSTLLLKKRAK